MGWTSQVEVECEHSTCIHMYAVITSHYVL